MWPPLSPAKQKSSPVQDTVSIAFVAFTSATVQEKAGAEPVMTCPLWLTTAQRSLVHEAAVA
jgi:hypothetical protein